MEIIGEEKWDDICKTATNRKPSINGNWDSCSLSDVAFKGEYPTFT
jgi:hypothetical protein